MKNSFLSVLTATMLAIPVNAQFSSIAEAVSNLPAMPTVEQIITSEAKDKVESTVYLPYNQAIEKMTMSDEEYIALNARIENARHKQAQNNRQAMQQYNRNVEAGLMPSQQEMMQIVMSSGINIEKATEQQIMDLVADNISKKWGISKEDYLKIITMAQRNPKQAEAYLQTNHPTLYKRLYEANAGGQAVNETVDARDEQFARISEDLTNLLEQLENVVANKQPLNADELQERWLASDEYKQVQDIESELWKRVEQWESGLSVGPSGFADVPYPDWWTVDKNKANALIDRWNRREAQQWLNHTNDYHRQLKDVFDKVAQLETENEQLARQGDSENIIYLTNKQRLLTWRGQLIQLMIPYRDALLFPFAEKFEETGSIHLGKG